MDMHTYTYTYIHTYVFKNRILDEYVRSTEIVCTHKDIYKNGCSFCTENY